MIKINNPLSHEKISSNCKVCTFFHGSRIVHDHDCIEMFFIAHGSITHILHHSNGKLEEQQMQAGDYLFMDYGAFHSFKNGTEDFQIINLLFSPDLIKKGASPNEPFSSIIHHSPFHIESVTLSHSPLHRVYHDTESGDIEALFYKALDVYKRQEYGYRELLRCYVIEILLISLRPLMRTPPPLQKHKVIQEICDYVAVHYAEHITLTAICRDKFFSMPYISKKFKEVMGMSFEQYLQEVRIRSACTMLSETPISIDDISVAVGYNDVTSFRRIFSKITGRKPSEYRKQNYKNN